MLVSSRQIHNLGSRTINHELLKSGLRGEMLATATENSACIHAPIFIDHYPSILTSATQV